MPESKLRDKVLLEIYKHRNNLNVSFLDFCKKRGITFEDQKQQERVLESLEDSNFIKVRRYVGVQGSDGIIERITSTGVDKAEMLARSIPEDLIIQNPPRKEKTFEEDETAMSSNQDSLQNSTYKTEPSLQKIQDENIKPCFQVEELAEIFLEQIDAACETDENNVCMIGIFAPWGRGKSYFFKKVKAKIEARKKEQQNKSIQYDVVEFNAWKYQDTPAIWAYLFETFFKKSRGCVRLRFNVKSYWKNVFAVFILLTIAVFALFSNCKFSCIASIFSGIGGVSNLIDLLIKYSFPALTLTKRFSKNSFFCDQLGIQAEIEKELAFVLKKWIPKKEKNKRVILYVDDIDRCPEAKMIAIIDSLRTVLENDDIKKRLVVVCSIEIEKIKLGITQKYKAFINNNGGENNKENKQKIIAIEQLDKIFLTGISLPPLTTNQQLEFLDVLSKNAKTTTTNLIQTEITKHQSPFDEKEIIRTSRQILTNSDIVKHIASYIKKENSLTPRKIRIIYYRIWLANNLIHAASIDKEINENIIKAIFELSSALICEKQPTIESLSPQEKNIVSMAVPYSIIEFNDKK